MLSLHIPLDPKQPIRPPIYREDIYAILAERQELRETPATRDIFDLFWLSSQCEGKTLKERISQSVLETAHDHIFQVGHAQFRDTVTAYLADEDKNAFSSPAVWDEIKLKTAHFLEELKNGKK